MPELRAEVENGPVAARSRGGLRPGHEGRRRERRRLPGRDPRARQALPISQRGGTSAGAIAATATAAAELGPPGRAERAASSRCARVADAICEPGRVLGLFQPRPENRSVFDLAVRMMDARAKGAGARRRVVTDSLRALWLPIAPSPLPGWRPSPSRATRSSSGWAGGRRSPGRRSPSRRRSGSLPRRLRGDLFVARPARSLARTLGDRQAGFGLCPGTSQPGFDGPALSDWLHEHIQRCAGRTLDDAPLTFADLKDEDDDSRSVSLQLMTTDVSCRPARAPAAPGRQPLLLRPGRDRQARPRERRRLDEGRRRKGPMTSANGRSQGARRTDAGAPCDADEPRRPRPGRVGALLRAARGRRARATSSTGSATARSRATSPSTSSTPSSPATRRSGSTSWARPTRRSPRWSTTRAPTRRCGTSTSPEPERPEPLRWAEHPRLRRLRRAGPRHRPELARHPADGDAGLPRARLPYPPRRRRGRPQPEHGRGGREGPDAAGRLRRRVVLGVQLRHAPLHALPDADADARGRAQARPRALRLRPPRRRRPDAGSATASRRPSPIRATRGRTRTPDWCAEARKATQALLDLAAGWGSEEPRRAWASTAPARPRPRGPPCGSCRRCRRAGRQRCTPLRRSRSSLRDGRRGPARRRAHHDHARPRTPRASSDFRAQDEPLHSQRNAPSSATTPHKTL